MAQKCGSCGKKVPKGAPKCPSCDAPIPGADEAGGKRVEISAGTPEIKGALSAGALVSLSLAAVLVAAGAWVVIVGLKSGKNEPVEPVESLSGGTIKNGSETPQSPGAAPPPAQPQAGNSPVLTPAAPAPQRAGSPPQPGEPGYASTGPKGPQGDPCDNLQMVPEIIDCWTKKYLSVEQENKGLYGKLLEMTDEQEKAALIDEQNEWFNKAFADAQAQSDKFKDQPLQPIVGYRTLCKLTKERTKELKTRLKALK